MERLVARINELARKHKTIGLDDTELAERALLREQYLQIFKRNFRKQLDSIEWTDEEPSLPN